MTRGKEYTALDHSLVQACLHLPADQFQQRKVRQTVRSLYDCPDIPVGPEGVLCRVIIATHPATRKKSPVGVTRAGVVFELFFTNLPQRAFTAYAASIRSDRPCLLRKQCQWNGSETSKPRQVSVLLHPLVVGDGSLLWRDWSRRQHRRACMQLGRDQQVDVHLEQAFQVPPETYEPRTHEANGRTPDSHGKNGW